jgi:hypothetical protein
MTAARKNGDWNASGNHDGTLLSYAFLQDSGIASAR